MSSLKPFFPIFQAHPDWVYFDNAATTHKPKTVIDALVKFYSEENATVHRTAYQHALQATDAFHSSRVAAQQFLNAKSVDEIVFTMGTTDAINLVARSYGKQVVKEGDEIWVSVMEHHSNLVPWQMLANETGAKLCYFLIDEQGSLIWDGTISDKAKIVAITHMSNVTGIVNPIQEIARQAHQVGAVVLVDGAQSAAHMEVDVQALDCDFYAFSSHKCYGPTGVGVLYGKQKLLEKMPPLQGGGGMIERVEMDQSTYQIPPLRFEAGTPNIAAVIGLKPALHFMQEVGLSFIAQKEHQLMHQAMEQIASIPGLRILGASSTKGPLLSFVVEDVHPLDLATLLDLDGIAVRSGNLCAQPLLREFGFDVVLRASFGVYNTEEDVERFTASLTRHIGKLRSPTLSRVYRGLSD